MVIFDGFQLNNNKDKWGRASRQRWARCGTFGQLLDGCFLYDSRLQGWFNDDDYCGCIRIELVWNQKKITETEISIIRILLQHKDWNLCGLFFKKTKKLFDFRELSVNTTNFKSRVYINQWSRMLFVCRKHWAD